MTITGEKKDMFVASLGEGDLIVYKVEKQSQLDIISEAHLVKIIQIVSLSKLTDKYFATRCINGHVNIWSATTHPDRLFTIENVDKDIDST